VAFGHWPGLIFRGWVAGGSSGSQRKADGYLHGLPDLRAFHMRVFTHTFSFHRDDLELIKVMSISNPVLQPRTEFPSVMQTLTLK